MNIPLYKILCIGPAVAQIFGSLLITPSLIISLTINALPRQIHFHRRIVLAIKSPKLPKIQNAKQ
jgi:hypothetical protein